MKKNQINGFTLVELIAVIAIIVFIGLVVTPEVLDIIKENRENSYHEIEKRLEEAAAKYVTEEYIDSSLDSIVITKEELVKLGYINEVYDLKDNRVCDASIYVYNLNSVAEYNSILTCSSYETKGKNAAWYISELYKKDDELNNDLYEPMIIIDEKEESTGIRYVGSNPNNYVYFNCDDKDSNNVSYGEKDYDYTSSCEIWRIIGVFDVDNGNGKVEKRLKLIRDEFVDNEGKKSKMSWDSSSSNGGIDNNSGLGINQWGESTHEDGSFYEGADLMRMLNGYYIGKESTCTYCNGENQGTCSNDCTSFVNRISDSSIKMIDDSVWYTGGTKFNPGVMLLEDVYKDERYTKMAKICEFTSLVGEVRRCTDLVNRTTEWIGKVGLIYVSDYGYASRDINCKNDISRDDSTCHNDNWLFPIEYIYWTITPNIGIADTVFRVYNSSVKNIENYQASSIPYVRPSLYLKSSVKIKSGSGTESSPYVLGM